MVSHLLESSPGLVWFSTKTMTLLAHVLLYQRGLTTTSTLAHQRLLQLLTISKAPGRSICTSKNSIVIYSDGKQLL